MVNSPQQTNPFWIPMAQCKGSRNKIMWYFISFPLIYTISTQFVVFMPYTLCFGLTRLHSSKWTHPLADSSMIHTYLHNSTYWTQMQVHKQSTISTFKKTHTLKPINFMVTIHLESHIHYFLQSTQSVTSVLIKYQLMKWRVMCRSE